MSDAGVELRPLSGDALRRHIADLAALRMRVFREFPYLYDGDADYERRYLDAFARSPRALIVLAVDRADGRVVGASSALPLADEDDAFQKPLRDAGYDVDRVFYCAESVLDAAYRGRGIGAAFFDQRETYARRLGGFDRVTFCAVVRPADHPRRPSGYRPLDAFWRRRGYRPASGLQTRYRWKDLDDDDETEKTLQFWLKAL